VAVLGDLVARPLPRSAFRALVERCPGISPGARRRALELGERYREETDARKYHDAAWPVIRHRHANMFQTEFALAQTRAACERAPDDMGYRVAMGIAQYRLGRFQERWYAGALATLVKCDETQPATLAFLAMARHRLGQAGQARADLNRLRDRLKEAGGPANVEAGQFLNEATELIEGKVVWAAHTP
jgi:hypothetical protein